MTYCDKQLSSAQLNQMSLSRFLVEIAREVKPVFSIIFFAKHGPTSNFNPKVHCELHVSFLKEKQMYTHFWNLSTQPNC